MSTLANVAEKAGVSISTVSQILNNRDMRRFPPETRERVRQAAEELRYRRSRSMSRRWQNASFTNTVSFVIGSPISWTESNRTPFYAEMTDGIQQEAHNHGFSLNLAAGLKTAREKIDYLRRVSDKGSVDGFLLASNIEPEVRSFLLENDLQAVFLGDHPLPVKDFGCVHGDNIQGGYLATQHLLNLGHRRIVFVGRCSALEFYRLRMTGYCRALVESGITADPLLICDYRIETGVKEELDRVFSLAQSPTAIFAGCHATALLVLEYLQEHGITAPE